MQQGGGLILLNSMGARVQGVLGFGSIEKVVNYLLTKNTSKSVDAISKVAQYGVRAGTNASEFGYFNGVNTGLQVKRLLIVHIKSYMC